MILYFTGTGNSRYVAKRLAEQVGDDLVSINDVLKNNREKSFLSQKPFVIVAPIYAWRFPRIIENFIKDARFEGNDKIYFVATMGAQSGQADKFLEKICLQKGITYGGFCGVVMPDNYVMLYPVQSKEEAIQTIQKSEPTILEIAGTIQAGGVLKKKDFTPLSPLFSVPVNKFFVHSMATDKTYNINSQCTLCGTCVNVCPVNNIEIRNGKIMFRHACIGCCACIHHCPTQALNGKRTEKNGRYLCPKV